MKLSSEMTNDQCINFCQSKSFVIAGTKSGTQCFCGNDLLGSALVSSGRCNMTCMGDATESTICGGPDTLSIWGFDSSFQQERSYGQSLSLAMTPGAQENGGMAYTKVQITSSIYTWPPIGSSATDPSTSLATSGLSEVEMAMLSVIASKVREREGATTQDFIGSISSVLNIGMSSIASDVPLENLTSGTASITGSSSVTFAPKPAIALTAVPTEATLYMTAMAGSTTAEAKNSIDDIIADDASATLDRDKVSSSMDEAEVDDTATIPILSATKRERRAHRRRSQWSK